MLRYKFVLVIISEIIVIPSTMPQLFIFNFRAFQIFFVVSVGLLNRMNVSCLTNESFCWGNEGWKNSFKCKAIILHMHRASNNDFVEHFTFFFHLPLFFSLYLSPSLSASLYLVLSSSSSSLLSLLLFVSCICLLPFSLSIPLCTVQIISNSFWYGKYG